MKSFKILSTIALLLCAALIFSCATTGGTSGQTTDAVPEPFNWNFDDEALSGWWVATGEFWQYKGPCEITRDTATFGKPMLRVDLDYSNSVSDWSEPKLVYDFDPPIPMRGITTFKSDFYYRKSSLTEGSFSFKIFCNNGGVALDASTGISDDELVDAGNGFVKAEIEIMLFDPIRRPLPDMRLGIVGRNTGYKGPVFFDNMVWE